MKKLISPFIILLISFATHFIYFGYPAQVVFDETYSIIFLRNYSLGTFFFDVHPPLAKLIFYVFSVLTGASYQTSMSNIGDDLSWNILLLRLIPILCGTLLPLVVYYISKKIGLSNLIATMAGILVAIENSLIVQSRFIFSDMLLVLSGFLAILFYLEYFNCKTTNQDKFKSRFYLIISALFGATAVSIKWTGLAFVAVIILYELVFNYEKIYFSIKDFLFSIKSMLPNTLIYFFWIFVVYVSSFAVSLYILPNTGSGDAFFPRQFISESFVPKFFDLNIEMYKANINNMPSHQYESTAITWPIMLRPIFYWQGVESYIYLIGNPFIYWFGLISIIFTTFYLFLKRKYLEKTKIPIFIFIGFMMNYVPFMWIIRPMFLYHYESALIFSIIATAWAISLIPSRKIMISVVSIVLIISICSYVFFAPLTYGLHLTDGQLKERMWFSTWR